MREVGMNILGKIRFPEWWRRNPAPGETRMIDTLPAETCPSTQAVHRRRVGRYLTVHRMLLAETGKDLPAVKRMVGVE